MTDEAQESGPTDSGDSPGLVHVSTLVPQPVEHVWRVINSAAGVQALLGDGVSLGSKGEPWHADDGSHGVLRSYHPLEQVRVSWHADEHGPATLIDLHLVPEGEHTRLDLRHEHLEAAPEIDAHGLSTRWSEALGRVAGLAS